jgi:hypothetical protein
MTSSAGGVAGTRTLLTIPPSYASRTKAWATSARAIRVPAPSSSPCGPSVSITARVRGRIDTVSATAYSAPAPPSTSVP